MKETMVTLLVFFLLFITIGAAEFFLTGKMGTSEDSSLIGQLFDVVDPSKETLVTEK